MKLVATGRHVKSLFNENFDLWYLTTYIYINSLINYHDYSDSKDSYSLLESCYYSFISSS
jgi:hypothetical protein